MHFDLSHNGDVVLYTVLSHLGLPFASWLEWGTLENKGQGFSL